MHAVLAPSSGGIWAPPGGCRAAPLFARNFPELGDRQAAEEGEASHWVAEQMLTILDDEHPRELELAPNGVTLTAEMIEGAAMYVSTVLQYAPIDGVKVEQRVDCPSIHEQCFGTPDAWWYDRAEHTLYIFDYKFGRTWVDVFENWQLVIYASGIMDLLGFNGLHDQHLKIRFFIVQPRAYGKGGPVREWTVSNANAIGSDLRAMINVAHNSAQEALSGEAKATSGPHCKHCPARAHCPAALAGGSQLYDASVDPFALELSDESLGIQLQIVNEAMERLGALKTGYEELIEHKLRQGSVVPGWQLSQSRGSEVWTLPDEQVLRLGQLMDVNLIAKPKTPNQARKLGLPPELVDASSEHRAGSLKLKPHNEKQLRKLFYV